MMCHEVLFIGMSYDQFDGLKAIGGATSKTYCLRFQ